MLNSTLDTTLDIMLLIFSALLLSIPLFKDLRKPVKIFQKGVWKETDKKKLTGFGGFFIVIFFLSVGTGVWKAIRDDNATNKANEDLTQLQIEYGQIENKYSNTQKNLEDKIHSDSLMFKRIFDSLGANKIYMDANFKIYQKPRVNILNSDHIQFDKFP